MADYEHKQIAVPLGPATPELIAEWQCWQERMRQDLATALYPNGREAAVRRLDEMCGLAPDPTVTGINREPITWWKRG